ncbi:hypothetical protein ABT116_14980 [Streptomyces sp. NPDC002130]
MIRVPDVPSGRLTWGTAVHRPSARQGVRHARRPPGREAAA